MPVLVVGKQTVPQVVATCPLKYQGSRLLAAGRVRVVQGWETCTFSRTHCRESRQAGVRRTEHYLVSGSDHSLIMAHTKGICCVYAYSWVLHRIEPARDAGVIGI